MVNEEGHLTHPYHLDPLYDHLSGERFPDICSREEGRGVIGPVLGNLTINQYAAKFVQLSRFTPIEVTTKSQKAQKFIRGLRADIYDCITILKLDTYAKEFKHT